MNRFLPRSLSGQFALVMAGALLVASLINFVLLLGERQRAALIEQSGPSIARFVDAAETIFASPPTANGRAFAPDRQHGPVRYTILAVNLIDQQTLSRNADLEDRLVKALSEAGITPSAIRAATRQLDLNGDPADGFGRPGRRDRAGQGDDLFTGSPHGFGPRGRGMPGPDGRVGPRDIREILLAAQLPDGRWLTGRSLAPETPQGDAFLLAIGTVVIFVCVLAAALWVAGRLSRPLRDLAVAAARVGAASEPQQISARAPGDVQQTIDAFNAMSLRVSQLLREKDVMLGALGHDLRTPLASLRIRIETMEPEAERLKAVKTIEETTELLEDILELSRQGKSREPERPVDIAVLVADIAEDYSETGAPVTLGPTSRAVAACRPVLLRRALRNLIDNAVTYGGAAVIGVSTGDGRAVISIDDDGPGMTPEALASATSAFFRGDASRNSETGGAGLGLTLADAIARAHGGSLKLENRTPSGLRATLSLPLAAPQAAS